MPKDNPITIPVFLHTSLSTSSRSSPPQNATRLEKPLTDRKTGAVYIALSYDTRQPSSSSSNPTNTMTPTAPPPDPVASKPRRKKFEAINVNDLDPSLFLTLVPTSTKFIERYKPILPPVLPPPRPGAITKKKGSSLSREMTVPLAKRMPRATEHGNPRSYNPSPKELMREERRARALAAQANAPPVPNAKHADIPPKRRGSNVGVTSGASPLETVAPTPTPAEHDFNTFAPRVGLQRTRSAGVTPISATVANAFVTSAVSVGSPLKLVTTPEDAVFPVAKRTRLSQSDQGQKPAETSRKANSLSPTSSAGPIPAITVQSATPASSQPTRRPKPTSKKVLQGGLEMRRVVSASSIGKKAGPPQEIARERSKREVVLPERLRDYDIESGSSTW